MRALPLLALAALGLVASTCLAAPVEMDTSGRYAVLVQSRQVAQARENLSWSSLKCTACKAIATLVQTLLEQKSSHDEIQSVVTKACILFKVETERVCRGAVELFAPEVLTVLDQLVVSPHEVCGLLLGSECADPYNPNDMWNVTFSNTPQPKPVYPQPPKTTSPKFRVLHLTDVHFDAEYKSGSVANCDEPLCCRDGSGGKDGAWKYGDYRNCDTPLWTLKNMLSNLAAKKDEFDYIIWTGDIPPHNVWNQTRADQKAVIAQVTKLLQTYLPGKTVFPSLGNHEGSPVNSFPPPYIKGENSIDWLYDALAEGWKSWLPQTALDTVKKGGFYSASPFPGLRVVSINMNYCNNINWWMLLNMTDPAGELQWLVNTLQAAENKGEKVHILGHIPPGSGDCVKAWSWNYYKIISRYQNTIAAQFFGHTHHDSFTVFYDVETLKIPVSIAYVGPSVTPFSNSNMGYRIYTVDGSYNGSSFQVLDHDTYYLNLTRANIEDKITWEHEYNAKVAYNMKNLFAKDWDNLITQMRTNDTLVAAYNRYRYKSYDPTGACDASCKSWLLCESRAGRSHDTGTFC